MRLSPDELRELARYILLTQPTELTCDEWLAYAPQYAELLATGAPLPDTLRQAAEHLRLCPECTEEFHACLAALQSAD